MNLHEQPTDGDDPKFEAALASLRPREDRLNRDRMMYLAGQASLGGEGAAVTAMPRRWAWPAAFSAMTTVATSLLAMVVLRGPSRSTPMVKVDPNQRGAWSLGFQDSPSPRNENVLTASTSLAKLDRWNNAASDSADELPLAPPSPTDATLRVRSFDELL